MIDEKSLARTLLDAKDEDGDPLLCATPFWTREGVAEQLAHIIASGMETRSAIDPKGRGPKGDSPTAEGGDAQTASHPKDIA